MEQLPNLVRDRLRTQPGGDHPEADVLTAFAERALPEAECSRVLTHLSHCADCRDVLALAVPPATGSASLDTAHPTRWFQWKVLRWGAAVACVVIVGSAVFLKLDVMAPKMASVAVVQEKQSGEQLAYDRVDQKERASQAMNAQATRTAREKDVLHLEEEISKANAPPERLPATPSPVQKVAGPSGFKKQVIAGQMQVGVANDAFAYSMNGNGGEARDVASTTPAISGVRPEVAETKGSALASSADKDLAIAGKTTETVVVHTGPATLEPVPPAAPVLDNQLSTDKREAVGKAKPSIGATGAMTTAESGGANYAGAVQAEQAVAQKMDRSKLRRSLVSRWTISSDGQLQHSIDAGQTWQPVNVGNKAAFRALSANGPDIWVGGGAGSLYHSRDSGFSWEQVKPSFGGVNLTGDISAIEFTDILHGKITTASGDAWTTEDGGQTWRK